MSEVLKWAAVLVFMISVPWHGVALADSSGTCGCDLSWSLSNDGVLTIGGTGPMEDFAQPGSAPWGKEPISVIIENGVTSIGNYAFYNCSGLTSLTIPDSVTRIGEYAFANCSSLISLAIPYGVTSIEEGTFVYCDSLRSVTIPDSVNYIGCFAFEYCYCLTSMVIPDSVILVNDRAFYRCSRLTSVTIYNPEMRFESMVFSGHSPRLVIYGSSGSEVEAYASRVRIPFKVLTSPDFIIPYATNTIEEEAFLNIAAITVQIPAAVTSITGNPFADSSVQYIYATPGTAAETFAASYGYGFVPVSQ